MRPVMHLFLALLLVFSLPLAMPAADEANDKSGDKIALADLPAPVKDGFAKEVPGGQMVNAKKLGGDKPGEKVRYLIHYKLEGKEHQITLNEEGARTQKKKEDKGDDGK